MKLPEGIERYEVLDLMKVLDRLDRMGARSLTEALEEADVADDYFDSILLKLKMLTARKTKRWAEGELDKGDFLVFYEVLSYLWERDSRDLVRVFERLEMAPEHFESVMAKLSRAIDGMS